MPDLSPRVSSWDSLRSSRMDVCQTFGPQTVAQMQDRVALCLLTSSDGLSGPQKTTRGPDVIGYAVKRCGAGVLVQLAGVRPSARTRAPARWRLCDRARARVLQLGEKLKSSEKKLAGPPQAEADAPSGKKQCQPFSGTRGAGDCSPSLLSKSSITAARRPTPAAGPLRRPGARTRGPGTAAATAGARTAAAPTTPHPRYRCCRRRRAAPPARRRRAPP